LSGTNQQRTKARTQLSLRAERAFGLTAIRRPPRADAAPGQAASAAASPETSFLNEASTPISFPEPTRREPPPSPTPARSPVDLFGRPASEQSAPQRGLMPPPTAEPFATEVLPRDQKIRRLHEMDVNEVKGCTRCRLCERRTSTVFGEGDPDAKICFIGEGPGENEDRTGRPFVGRAGELLDQMIVGMGLRREQVFIVNIVKCRPPGNREPAPDEVATCTSYLERQLEIIRPQVIVTLGRPSAQHMLQTKVPISRIRGQWQSWRGIRLMPTFHPAYILRNYTPATRAAVWDDLKKVLIELGLPVPAPARRGKGE
jgi:uracil-DNA glycosylase family 4